MACSVLEFWAIYCALGGKHNFCFLKQTLIKQPDSSLCLLLVRSYLGLDTIVIQIICVIQAVFTLYLIGFCSVSKVAPVQCEQELMFCCGEEIVPKRSQCEQKPYPLCNLQRSLFIWKDNLPIRGSVAISAPIKVFRLDSDRLKNLSDTERSTLNSGAEQYCSGAETASKAAFLVWTEARSGTLSAT